MTLNKTDRIVITLGKQIVHGKYVPGSPLPAEAELCEEFATSRNIIREVFRSLMAKRLIEMKRYRGAFVAPRNQWNYLDTDVLQWVLENDYDPRLISAMSEVRNLVEPAIARWAAERATSSDLAQIESALNEMIANNQDREAFNEADIRYHEAVLQSVHNPVLQQLSIAISSLQRAVFERTWMGDEANMPQTLQEHKALFDAIRHQDGDAAEQAAQTLGYRCIRLTDCLSCEAREAGRFLSAAAQYHAGRGKALALLAGGETVVHVTGSGLGGRNQELALAAAPGLEGLSDAAVFSFGSDGTDGPTDAAGGYADGRTAAILRALGRTAEAWLDDNDAWHALAQTGGLLRTGPTGTNVNDLSVLLIGKPRLTF